MNASDVFSAVAQLITQKFEHDGAITPATVADDIEGWDSVAHVELIIEIEQRFGIRLTTGEAADLPNVGALVSVVERHLRRNER